MRSGLTIPKLLGVCLAFQHKKGGKTEDAVRADCDFLFVLRVIYISRNRNSYIIIFEILQKRFTEKNGANFPYRSHVK
jgi:hypothetical protein